MTDTYYADDDNCNNNTIVLSGTITKIHPSQVQHMKEILESNSISITRDIRLDMPWAIGNDKTGCSFYKCTCNSFYFFILYNYQEKIFIDMFRMPESSDFPESTLKEPILLDNCKYEIRDISFFCSDTYIFCSFIYRDENNNDCDFRYLYFSLIDQDSHQINSTPKFQKKVRIIEPAFDYTGNNKSFAFFYFKGFKDYENKIYTFSLYDKWELKKIDLIKPRSETNFYSSKYIKMVFYNDELYLIGENQKLMRSANSSRKYSVNKDCLYITGIYTIENLNPVRILNRKKGAQVDQIMLKPGFKIEVEEKMKEQDLFISHCLNIPIQYKSKPTEWIRSKSSCIFHSSAYLKHVEYPSGSKKPNDDFENDTEDAYLNLDKAEK